MLYLWGRWKKVHVRQKLLQLVYTDALLAFKGEGLPGLNSICAQERQSFEKKVSITDLAADAGHAAVSLQVSRGIHTCGVLFSTMQVGLRKIHEGFCFPPCSMPKSQKKRKLWKNSEAVFFQASHTMWLSATCKNTYCASCTDPIHLHLVPPCPTSSVLLSSCPLQGMKVQRSQSITHHKWYICHLLLRRNGGTSGVNLPHSLLWENYSGPFFFPLEKHRHKMQLSLNPTSYCNARNCGHQGILIFLPFYSDT